MAHALAALLATLQASARKYSDSHDVDVDAPKALANMSQDCLKDAASSTSFGRRQSSSAAATTRAAAESATSFLCHRDQLER